MIIRGNELVVIAYLLLLTRVWPVNLINLVTLKPNCTGYASYVNDQDCALSSASVNFETWLSIKKAHAKIVKSVEQHAAVSTTEISGFTLFRLVSYCFYLSTL